MKPETLGEGSLGGALPSSRTLLSQGKGCAKILMGSQMEDRHINVDNNHNLLELNVLSKHGLTVNHSFEPSYENKL